jgi:hypothetical protein
MGISEILASVDREIALLKQARALLGAASAAVPPKKRGRPRKAIAAVTPEPAKPVKTKRKKRHLTPEGRKRIAEAVKRRWEIQKKAAAAVQK